MRRLLSNATLFTLLAFSTYAHATNDVANAFVDMDQTCALDRHETRELLKWLSPDINGHITGKAPAFIKNSAKPPKVTDRGEYWQVDVPLVDSTYKGLPLVRIERWYGKDNGVNGYAIVFSGKVAEVVKHFKSPRFKADPESEKTEPVWETTTRKPGSAVLSCDFST